LGYLRENALVNLKELQVLQAAPGVEFSSGTAEDYKGCNARLVKEYLIDASPSFIMLARDLKCVFDTSKLAEDFLDILGQIKQAYVTGQDSLELVTWIYFIHLVLFYFHFFDSRRKRS
jgi:hypothetical protein